MTSPTGHSRRSGRPGRPRRSSRSGGHARPAQAQAPQTPLESSPHDPTPVPFDSIPFDDRLHAGIQDRGFTLTTPVQSAVFPIVLEGSDLIACAQTGTGKTAGFVLPIMQRLLDHPRPPAPEGQPVSSRVLVLAPTRELAVQIEDDVQGFGYHTQISGAAVYGGVDGDLQARALRAGVDIVVATPGRLLDHMRCAVTNFEALEVLVLDEADRMLDMGFWPDVQRIVAALPTERQTLLFSATMSAEVARVAEPLMRNPKVVMIGTAGKAAATISHQAHAMPAGQKVDWLVRFLRRSHEPALVFVRTRRGADQLYRRLAAQRIRCVALHADRTQAERTAAVEGFRSGTYKVLVATDIAARGLDIYGIGHVINYDVPDGTDAYVHRAGRTGRAEATGTAITLVSPEEMRTLRAIQQTIDITFPHAEKDRSDRVTR